MYRGMIMKATQEREIVYTAYSLIDMVSASGGIIAGLLAVFGPVAELFSRLTFDLSVMAILFRARTTRIDESL